MASLISIQLVLLACFVFSNYVVEADVRLISKEEDIELENQLNLLNKHAIKSIQTKYGDIYNCVNFYKQPAFDHPLLKNHTFHPKMRPFMVPKLRKQKKYFKASRSISSHIWINGVGCPFGTVPIRKVTKDDLIREKNYIALTAENPGTHYAVVHTILDSNKKYNGGGTLISIHKPSVTGSQYSSARMKIQNGLESIQVGWTVNPILYGDNHTRLYTYLNAGQMRCFNTRCPGFIIVDTSIPLDLVLTSSEKGRQPSIMRFLIYRDAPVGNWWLEISDFHTKVGFWPQRIFTTLADLATSVEWGGEVFSPPDVPSPQMGSGDFLRFESYYDAYCREITIINETNKIVDPVKLKEYVDTRRYDSADMGNDKSVSSGHLMYFGGPGGAIGT